MTTARRLRCRRLCAAVIMALVWAMSRSSPIGQAPSGAQSRDPAATLFSDADATRATGRVDDAIGKYQRVMAEYPASIWAARSALESARSMVGQGNWAPAMRQMEDVYLRFPRTPEAEHALERNTILHRLRLRQGQPLFRYARTAASGNSLRRVVDVAVDSAGQVHVATRQSVAVFNDSGGLVRTEPTNELRAFTLRGETPTLLFDRSLRQGAGALVPILIPDQNRQREADIQAGALASDERLLISDRRTKAIHVVSPTGAYQSRFTAVDAVRLAVGAHGQVAAIERETQVPWLFGADGQGRPLPVTGTGYQLRGPIDVAFDSLGHLYVLERDSVFVFTPAGEFMSVFAPGAAAGAFRMAVAFHVDDAGRLYIYDEDTERLQVFH